MSHPVSVCVSVLSADPPYPPDSRARVSVTTSSTRPWYVHTANSIKLSSAHVWRPCVLQPFFSSPDFIGTDAPSGLADDTPIDLVFVDFIESQLLEILNGLQSDRVYTTADVLEYTDVLASAVLGIYAQQYWN